MDKTNKPAIYESKAPTKKANFLILLSIILLISSVGCLALRNAKHEKTTMKFSVVDSNGNIVSSDEKNGYINGNVYYLTEEGRQMCITGFCILLFMGIYLFSIASGIKRCVLTIYDDHISGVQFSTGFTKKTFSLPFDKINSASYVDGAIVIRAGTAITIMCVNAEEVYNHLWTYCPKIKTK